MPKFNQILNKNVRPLWQVLMIWGMLIIAVPVDSAILPDDSGVTNVKTFGAIGDGITDDTQAIQTALKDGNRFIYLPQGTYLVCDTLKIAQTGKRYYFQGENREKTIIKLKDNCPGFADSSNPKAVINTQGPAGQAFQNSVFDLTVDIGKGNQGAIAIAFLNNNQGTIRNVTVKSTDPEKKGFAGIDLTLPWPGPGIIKDVKIIGFNFGIKIGFPEFGMVLENVTLENQREVGIENSANLLSIRKLTSNNSVPAIRNTDSRSLVVLIDGNFQGGAGSELAIENKEGVLYARNLKVSGYQFAIANRSNLISEDTFTEFISDRIYSLFPTPQTSLHLPVEDVTTVPDDNLNNWVSVTKYGANGSDKEDDTLAIQKAIDSGKSTVYFPRGTYYISQTVRVRGNVKRITGLGSTIAVTEPFSNQNQPVFRLENGNQNVVTLEHFWGNYSNYKNFYWVDHASARTLFLRNIAVGAGKAYRNTGAGNLFIEDVSAGEWIFNRQKVWARQLNPEGDNTKIINNGGTLWILGLKTEDEGTVVETINGGKTEVLGGLIYPGSGNIPDDQPAFINNESFLSVVIGESHHGGARYHTFVKEVRKGVTKTLLHQDLPRRGSASVIPLYVGYQGNADTVSVPNQLNKREQLKSLKNSKHSANWFANFTNFVKNILGIGEIGG